jgi:transcription antitermination factor NusG
MAHRAARVISIWKKYGPRRQSVPESPEFACQNFRNPHLERTIVSDACWYAVQTRSRHESVVTSVLEQQEFTAFLPLTSQWHRWSDRVKLVRLPLFPGYVFVRIVASVEARVRILRTPGVVRLVGARGEGAPIPDIQIETIRQLLSNGISFVHHPFLTVGRRVRIRGGSMEGIEGILLRRNGDRSLVISVEMIERSVAIRVDGFTVEEISPLS